MAITLSKALTSATTVLYASAVLPATFDEAGYEGLTWTALAECNNIGQIGGTVAMQQHRPIDTGLVVKIPSSRDEGTAEITMAKHKGADVTLLQNAFEDRAPIALKIVYPAALGTTAYTAGYISTNVTTIGTSDSILEFRTTFDLAVPLLEVETA